MAVIWVSDLKEGDLIEVKDPIQKVKLAVVERITRDGQVVIRRHCHSPSARKTWWGVPHEIPLAEIVRLVEKV